MRLLYYIFIAPLLWMFRITLWILFPIFGLIASMVHGRNKRHRRLVRATREAPQLAVHEAQRTQAQAEARARGNGVPSAW